MIVNFDVQQGIFSRSLNFLWFSVNVLWAQNVTYWDTYAIPVTLSFNLSNMQVLYKRHLVNAIFPERLKIVWLPICQLWHDSCLINTWARKLATDQLILNLVHELHLTLATFTSTLHSPSLCVLELAPAWNSRMYRQTYRRQCIIQLLLCKHQNPLYGAKDFVVGGRQRTTFKLPCIECIKVRNMLSMTKTVQILQQP